MIKKYIRIIPRNKNIPPKIIIKLLNYLGYEGQIVRNSELGVGGTASDLVLNICKECGADIYLSGQGGKDYLNLERFEGAEISVEFQNYQHQEYQQCFPKAGFCKGLSIVDLLFNEGKNSLTIIENGRIE